MERCHWSEMKPMWNNMTSHATKLNECSEWVERNGMEWKRKEINEATWRNEWTKKKKNWVRGDEITSEDMKWKEWSEWVNEWMNERLDGWMDPRPRLKKRSPGNTRIPGPTWKSGTEDISGIPGPAWKSILRVVARERGLVQEDGDRARYLQVPEATFRYLTVAVRSLFFLFF